MTIPDPIINFRKSPRDARYLPILGDGRAIAYPCLSPFSLPCKLLMNFEGRPLKTFWLGFVHLLSHHVMQR
jgi:hypothetical protein